MLDQLLVSIAPFASVIILAGGSLILLPFALKFAGYFEGDSKIYHCIVILGIIIFIPGIIALYRLL